MGRIENNTPSKLENDAERMILNKNKYKIINLIKRIKKY